MADAAIIIMYVSVPVPLVGLEEIALTSNGSMSAEYSPSKSKAPKNMKMFMKKSPR